MFPLWLCKLGRQSYRPILTQEFDTSPSSQAKSINQLAGFLFDCYVITKSILKVQTILKRKCRSLHKARRVQQAMSCDNQANTFILEQINKCNQFQAQMYYIKAV